MSFKISHTMRYKGHKYKLTLKEKHHKYYIKNHKYHRYHRISKHAGRTLHSELAFINTSHSVGKTIGHSLAHFAHSVSRFVPDTPKVSAAKLHRQALPKADMSKIKQDNSLQDQNQLQ